MKDGTQSKNAKENSKKRYLTWAVIGYPESLPDNWTEILEELKIPVLVSPLHDSDVNADGEPKKPHYHIILRFSSVKSLSQVKEISDRLNAPNPQKQDDFRGSARYLCHLDNPSKAQYPTSGVLAFGGADYLSLIGRSSDKYAAIGEMMDFIDSSEIYSYAELMRYSREHNESWFRALCDNCGWTIKEYMQSCVWEKKDDLAHQLETLHKLQLQCLDYIENVD